jgi:Reverse transcriptase (RNA-dependent DNA polymerase)
LIKCLESYSFPPWILNFLKSIISNWKLSIRSKSVPILEKPVGRGILQGDSLSPLLFVLSIYPLSRQLNGIHKKVNVPTDSGMYATNHLLFVDYLKLMAESDEELKMLMKETKEFFKAIGLEMTKDKSATNTEACAEDVSRRY